MASPAAAGRSLEDILRDAQAATLSPERAAAFEARESAEAFKARVDRIYAIGLPVTGADEQLLARGELRENVGASLKAVRGWLADKSATGTWLVLCGSTGRGKTLAACEAVLRSGGLYVGARELERLHMTRFGDETVQQYERLCRSEGLVVVDDIGREDKPERMTSALLDLVDQRRGSRHRTIAISNMSDGMLRTRYPDARLWSRLGECARWVVDTGEDLRGRK